jgi:hypothetical protein
LLPVSSLRAALLSRLAAVPADALLDWFGRTA